MTGRAYPNSERQRIFERFVRLDSSKPGHGLGLAIARRIAQQHDGDLTCDPAPNGASFTLRIPTSRDPTRRARGRTRVARPCKTRRNAATRDTRKPAHLRGIPHGSTPSSRSW